MGVDAATAAGMAARGVVFGQAPQGGAGERAVGVQPRGPPAGHHHQVVRAEPGPPGLRPYRKSLGGADVLLLGDEDRPVPVPEVGRGGEDLRGSGQVEQVQPRGEQEDDQAHDPVSSATVATVAKRPARAYSVRRVIRSVGRVRGSARTSSRLRPGGASRCSMGVVAVASVTKVTV